MSQNKIAKQWLDLPRANRQANDQGGRTSNACSKVSLSLSFVTDPTECLETRQMKAARGEAYWKSE